MAKVCKFGGTSMSCKDSIMQSASIVKAESDRKFVIVSAPGKRFSQDMKVTDLLYSAYNEKVANSRCGESFEKIRSRFTEIVEDLKIDLDIKTHLDEVEVGINNSTSKDYAASRGEYLSAIIMAKVLDYDFIDAKDIIKFDENNIFDSELTNKLVSKLTNSTKGVVIPGFYGSKADGTVVTFSRGGSDVSGAIIARGVNADVYENWTDVNGFMVTDPRIVKNSKTIPALSYEELRELSYMGASVLHPESIFPVKHSGIAINIKNTFNPSHKGTFILPSTDGYRKNIVTGIAGNKGNTTILIKKSMMNNEIGFARKVLSVLEQVGVSFEHLPTGIDTMSVVINNDVLTQEKEKAIVDGLNNLVHPNEMEVFHNLALIAVVGHGMANQLGTAAKIFNALFEAKINIRMIDQGSSELNIIIGVMEKDYENAIQAIYNAFFE